MSVDLLGPFDYFMVVLDGEPVRGLNAHPLPDGRVQLSAGSQMIELTEDQAHWLMPFIAACLRGAS